MSKQGYGLRIADAGRPGTECLAHGVYAPMHIPSDADHDRARLAGYPDATPCRTCSQWIARNGACGCSPHPLADPKAGRLCLQWGLDVQRVRMDDRPSTHDGNGQPRTSLPAFVLDRELEDKPEHTPESEERLDAILAVHNASTDPLAAIRQAARLGA